MKPPKWNDDEALAEFVADVFLEWEASDARDEAERGDVPPPIRVTVTAASIERWAIEHAERGDFKALADIFERGDDLSPKAKAMIASKLRGTFKGKRGVLKRTIWERADMDWKIDAAEEVDKIRAILKRHYPKERGHTDRAIAIAAVRASERVRKGDEFGEVSHDKLDNYYRKSRHRRRWR